ncbi:hypothetical protein [Rubinisphaera brasiliensis]|uniref:Sulfatase N-terminal domain-containing protein n=1 Tax=Rubinisphaera brasiliensis (strain ATCC 49424 / DSM 5305 / JCM 21570 / IAM 15109 / NBRC 103401 / IFAM 1448) TaxID=756272 RepID=F0SS16_RUBBR|nr:hypothetical protein [Rubinisphaera brasiliensis]ADY61354.1 hypothetical protein Plabr_3764 [Rubinisphaera brasiliensis DSM 5305]
MLKRVSLLGCSAAYLVLFCISGPVVAARPTPNVILFMADDMCEKLLSKAKSTGIHRIFPLIIMRFKSPVFGEIHLNSVVLTTLCYTNYSSRSVEGLGWIAGC